MDTDSQPVDDAENTRYWERMIAAIRGKQYVQVWADYKRWQAAQAAAPETDGEAQN